MVYSITKKDLIARGFNVSIKSCYRTLCICAGEHFSISGHGIRRNNVYTKEIEEIIKKYPVIFKNNKRRK